MPIYAPNNAVTFAQNMGLVLRKSLTGLLDTCRVIITTV